MSETATEPKGATAEESRPVKRVEGPAGLAVEYYPEFDEVAIKKLFAYCDDLRNRLERVEKPPPRHRGPRILHTTDPSGRERLSVRKCLWLVTAGLGAYTTWKATGELPSINQVEAALAGLAVGGAAFTGYRGRMAEDRNKETEK